METSTDEFSPIYVGEIEILIEDICKYRYLFEHRDLVAKGKYPRSISTSPLELHEVDSTDDEKEVHSYEPSHLVGSL